MKPKEVWIMVRVLVLLAVLVTGAVVFAACGAGEDSAFEPAPAEVAPEPAEPAPAPAESLPPGAEPISEFQLPPGAQPVPEFQLPPGATLDTAR